LGDVDYLVDLVVDSLAQIDFTGKISDRGSIREDNSPQDIVHIDVEVGCTVDSVPWFQGVDGSLILLAKPLDEVGDSHFE